MRYFLLCFCLQDMVTQHRYQMVGKASALSTLRLASPSPYFSSLLWCKGSWCTVHGGRSCTSTHAGACPNLLWPLFMPLYSPCLPSLASSSSLLRSSQQWRRTGTSLSLSTSASFHSAPSAWEITYLESPPTRGSGSSTKWESLVSANEDSYFSYFS